MSFGGHFVCSPEGFCAVLADSDYTKKYQKIFKKTVDIYRGLL